MVTGHPILNGGKIPHVQEVAAVVPVVWFAIVNVMVLMVEVALVLEVAMKSNLSPVIPKPVPPMVFGDNGNNSQVVNHVG